MKKHAAPIIAAILLLLPLLYVGSYLALVSPLTMKVGAGGIIYFTNYRVGDEVAAGVFWPLEQLDRKARPGYWVDLDIRSSHGAAS